MTRSTRGQLLVATPVLHDPNFDRTVVAMLEHNADGALGVVLTHPSETPTRLAVPQLSSLVRDDDVVHIGGPVAPEAAIAVAECDIDVDGFLEVAHGVGTLDLPSSIDEHGDPVDDSDLFEGVKRCRLFAGYSGWGPGQLDSEVSVGAWFVVEMLPDDLFGTDHGALWQRVLRRQPGDIAWFANYPDDLDSN
jgi:putative transcriptional regulator